MTTHVTIGQFPDSVAADLARMALADAGIEAFVLDRHMADQLHALSGPLPRPSLAVRPEDADAAREVLGTHEASQPPATRERSRVLGRRLLLLILGWTVITLIAVLAQS